MLRLEHLEMALAGIYLECTHMDTDRMFDANKIIAPNIMLFLQIRFALEIAHLSP